MKQNIHPTYFPDAQVVCSCGNTFTTGSTKKSVTVEVCYKCHPFYTGEQRFLDTKGRVEMFQKKQEAAKAYSSSKKKKTDKKEKSDNEPKSLLELLGQI